MNLITTCVHVLLMPIPCTHIYHAPTAHLNDLPTYNLIYQMEAGTHGKRQADLLLTATTIPTTVLQIICVVNGAILHLWMVQHQIW